MAVTKTTTYSAGGDGALTAATLISVLQDFPADAVVSVTMGDSQREGQYWSVKAVTH